MARDVVADHAAVAGLPELGAEDHRLVVGRRGHDRGGRIAHVDELPALAQAVSECLRDSHGVAVCVGDDDQRALAAGVGSDGLRVHPVTTHRVLIQANTWFYGFPMSGRGTPDASETR